LLLWHNVRHSGVENTPSQQQALFPLIFQAEPVALMMQHETFPVSPRVTFIVWHSLAIMQVNEFPNKFVRNPIPLSEVLFLDYEVSFA
jgi:hypothetical protein